ncbi:hypothetical protein NPIL_41171 [Nephila pilipes]|uniref:Uncharacterized protein n=1 Tax=Nephila pilipes TaxID=299642 RepID=A0A8X6MTH0_NEPPI|nr:hypothetical protein NPIL_41171 [Nephila pilipes]
MLEFTETMLQTCLLGEGNEPPPHTHCPFHRTSEVHSLFLAIINTTWETPPEHAGLNKSLQCSCPRLAHTTPSRLRTGHIKSLMLNANEKTYAVCRCSAFASLSHILDCIGAFVGQLLNKGDVVFDLIVRHGLLDVV